MLLFMFLKGRCRFSTSWRRGTINPLRGDRQRPFLIHTWGRYPCAPGNTGKYRRWHDAWATKHEPLSGINCFFNGLSPLTIHSNMQGMWKWWAQAVHILGFSATIVRKYDQPQRVMMQAGRYDYTTDLSCTPRDRLGSCEASKGTIREKMQHWYQITDK